MKYIACVFSSIILMAYNVHAQGQVTQAGPWIHSQPTTLPVKAQCPKGAACTQYDITKRQLLTTICEMYNNRENFPDDKFKTDKDFAALQSYYPKWYAKAFTPKDCPQGTLIGSAVAK